MDEKGVMFDQALKSRISAVEADGIPTIVRMETGKWLQLFSVYLHLVQLFRACISIRVERLY
jgi:hypothetical protein